MNFLSVLKHEFTSTYSQKLGFKTKNDTIVLEYSSHYLIFNCQWLCHPYQVQVINQLSGLVTNSSSVSSVWSEQITGWDFGSAVQLYL